MREAEASRAVGKDPTTPASEIDLVTVLSFLVAILQRCGDVARQTMPARHMRNDVDPIGEACARNLQAHA